MDYTITHYEYRDGKPFVKISATISKENNVVVEHYFTDSELVDVKAVSDTVMGLIADLGILYDATTKTTVILPDIEVILPFIDKTQIAAIKSVKLGVK